FARGADAPERGIQVVQLVEVADGHQDAAGARANRRRRNLVVGFHVELVQFAVGVAAFVRQALGESEQAEKYQREDQAGDGSHLLGEQVVMAMAVRTVAIMARPSGISFEPMRRFSGTRYSRSPGCVKRSTSTASAFITKLHTTPKA